MTKRPLDLRQTHRLLSPGPVTLLTTQYRGQPNVMTAAWLLPASLEPPLVGVAIYPGRLTHDFVLKSEQFVLNFPPVDLMTAVQQCGLVSGRDEDKFLLAGLTMTEAVEVEAPLIAECLAHIECGVVDRVRFGDHDLFIAQPLAVQADDAAFTDHWQTSDETGLLLHHLGANRYAALGKSYRVAWAPEE